jgi:hypothetical protein
MYRQPQASIARNHAGTRLILPLLLVLALAASMLPGIVQARDTNVIQVKESDAQPNFPMRITFSLNARSTDAPISEVELLYGSTRADSRTIVPIDITPDDQIDVQHVLDTQQYFLPVGIELSYNWIIRDAAGNILETPTQELVYHDERFPWQELSERGVTIYWYDGSDQFGAEMMQIATRTLDRLQTEIGATVDDSVKIYIYANQRDLRSALQPNSVEWVGGQAMPSLGLITGIVAGGDMSEAKRIIPHELSHQVLHQAVENPYGGTPLWLDEGLAVHNQETLDSVFPQMLEQAARTDQLIPLEALASSFPADPNRALLSYAQSNSVVEYIIDDYGTDKLAQLVDTFREATPVDEAVSQVFGLSVDELHAEWRETLPAAQTSVPLEGSSSVAPPDRFRGEPVLPGDSGSAFILPGQDTRQPAQAATQPEAPASLVPGLGLPNWAVLALFGSGCVASLLMLGAAGLLTLHLTRARSG